MKRSKAISVFSLILAALLIFCACASAESPAAYYEADSMGAAPVPGAVEYEALRYSYVTEEHNTEEYSAIKENGFQAVSTAPLSTFAADVDTASYANLRRMINNGKTVEPDAVRIEEMLNYFTYDYPEPEAGEPFSVTMEIGECPWNQDTKLLLIGLQAEKIDTDALPPSNLVFLIDVSGSMDSPDKLPLVKQAFQLLTEQLGEQDSVSIVTYASSDAVVLSGVSGENRDDILYAIENLTAGGSTNGSQGIERAYALAEENFIEGGNNRVILATDGDLNLGVTSEGALTRLIKEKKETGVYLSVLGFGEGNLKDNKMQALADNGNGNYYYIDSLSEARKVLVSEIGGTCFTVAKDVKLQVEFNPAYLKGYRLIGYENRVMDAADFADDTKDGGELGSGHRVTVLYEIVPVDSSMELGSALKYQSAVAGASEEWLTLSIRYKEPEASVSRELNYPLTGAAEKQSPSDNMLFACAVAEAGMLLRNSEYAGFSSYGSALLLLEETDYITDPSKTEFHALLEKLKNRAG